MSSKQRKCTKYIKLKNLNFRKLRKNYASFWGMMRFIIHKKCKILLYFLSTWSQDVFLYLGMIGEKIPEISYNSNWVGLGGGHIFISIFLQ